MRVECYESRSSGLSPGAVAGIVVGALVAAIVCAITIRVGVRKLRKHRGRRLWRNRSWAQSDADVPPGGLQVKASTVSVHAAPIVAALPSVPPQPALQPSEAPHAVQWIQPSQHPQHLHAVSSARGEGAPFSAPHDTAAAPLVHSAWAQAEGQRIDLMPLPYAVAAVAPAPSAPPLAAGVGGVVPAPSFCTYCGGRFAPGQRFCVSCQANL